ncbi:MAG TPA: glycine betaine ABC transporter substrate-binding protein [Solirubrobacteraceae bacterium]|jgi:osmoprotectant transport system substrate-binding protein|nr:glycine betaine ABC transporter substrate-binding protein [Solirubrobacteraceae bacterium]
MRIRSLGAALAFVLAPVLAACGSSNSSSSTTTSAAAKPGAGKPAITMGAKNFTEEFVLGELYSQALRAKGYTVKLKSNIGSSEITDKALTSGQIDAYPEYTGVIATELAGGKDQPKSAEATYQAAEKYESKRGFTVLEPTPFFDADGLAVKPAYAKKNGLTAVADLSKVGTFSYGAPPENRTRYQGLKGMQQAYGLTHVDFKPLAIGLQYTALDAGKIDVAAIFTTDAKLAGGKYTVLKDTKGIFGFQNVVPVVSKKVLTAEGPEFSNTLNAVSAKLTNTAMQTMNAAVDIDKKKPADVAKTFLQANGLL